MSIVRKERKERIVTQLLCDRVLIFPYSHSTGFAWLWCNAKRDLIRLFLFKTAAIQAFHASQLPSLNFLIFGDEDNIPR